MRVKIEDAQFLLSAASESNWPPGDVPEVAFAGRSNVGKSSLINGILGRKALARVSSTPGRTRTLNFLDVRLVEGSPVRDLRMVDLPGYGYAKVSKQERKKWGPMIESYLMRRKGLALVMLVVDSRHPPSDLDQGMASWLNDIGSPWLCVATKLDKLPRAKRIGAVRSMERALGLPPHGAIGFSAEDGTGREDVWQRVIDACAAA